MNFPQIIRQLFANLTTRRLGTRGQSRYHYYGLAVLPTSIYYSPNYSSRKLAEPPLDFKCPPKDLVRKSTDAYDVPASFPSQVKFTMV